MTEGTLTDFGRAMFVNLCPETCYESFYFEGPLVDKLRPYAGTETVVQFFREEFCGTIEGCAMHVDRYEFGDCDPVQAASTT